MELKYIIKISACLLVVALLLPACKKFLDVKSPVDQVESDKIFETDAAAIAAVNGIYSEMMNGPNQFTNNAVTFYAGMCADELYHFQPGTRDEFVKNEISAANHSLLTALFWTPAYKYIYITNLCLERLAKSATVTPAIKTRLIGECKFIRAFCYFHLVNLFGGVPLELTSDYRVNETHPRETETKIYEQIIRDLEDAKSLLPEQSHLPERSSPSRMAATAMLARVYLYLGQWAKAETAATAVIGSGRYSLTTNLSDVFLKGSNETIWQLAPVTPSRNTWEGFAIVPTSNSAIPTYLLTPELLNSFEPGDGRKDAWTKLRSFSGQVLYYPYKYKIRTGTSVSEYYIMLRLAELYLIRAEALAKQERVPDAVDDLNIVRLRAGLSPLLRTIDKPHCLQAVAQERKTELFAEWGNRWYDLKRTGEANTVLGALNPATWQPTDVLWPIPTDQIKLNAALKQNPGY